MRRPNRETLRRLVDMLARLKYNELFLYSEMGGNDSSLVESVSSVEVMIRTMDPEGLQKVREEGVCEVMTGAECSLAGRLETMRERMAAAEQKHRGVKRLMVTDFSDGCDWHSPVVSLPGLVMGAYFGLVGAKAAKMDLELELSRFLDAPLAALLLRLGTLYLRGGAYHPEASEYFNILSGDCGYSRHQGITDSVLEEVSSILRVIIGTAERYLPRSETAKEIIYTALLMDAACHRRSAMRLKSVKEEFIKMWNRHFISARRDEVADRLPRF